MNENKLEKLIEYFNDNINTKMKNHNHYGIVYFIKSEIKKNKKNILLISHELKNTGAPIVLLDMGIILRKMGFNVFLISLEDGILVDSFIKNNIPVIISNKMKKYQFSKSINKNVSFFLDDIIDFFDFSIFNTITLFNYVKRYDGKYNKIMWWIHEGTTILDIPELKNLYPKKLHGNIHVYCVSDYCKKLMENRGLNYNTKILHYGIKNNNILSPFFSHKHDKKIFLTIGTITYRKGQKLLIDAIKSMPAEINQKSKYIFVGKVNTGDIFGLSVVNELQELINQTEFVSYCDSIPHDEIFNLYNQVDAIIVPSYDDPLPVVATECMMMKKNVICSEATGTASLFDNIDDSFVFKTGDYMDLVEKIKLFHKNSNLVKKNRELGYKIYNKHFKYNVFKNNIKKMIKDLEG